MDAQIYPSKEECAIGTEQRGSSATEQHGQRNNAAVMDALICPSKEECAIGTEQRGSYAAAMNALI